MISLPRIYSGGQISADDFNQMATVLERVINGFVAQPPLNLITGGDGISLSIQPPDQFPARLSRQYSDGGWCWIECEAVDHGGWRIKRRGRFGNLSLNNLAYEGMGRAIQEGSVVWLVGELGNKEYRFWAYGYCDTCESSSDDHCSSSSESSNSSSSESSNSSSSESSSSDEETGSSSSSSSTSESEECITGDIPYVSDVACVDGTLMKQMRCLRQTSSGLQSCEGDCEGGT